MKKHRHSTYREEQASMEARFRCDTRNHRMEIVTDNGLHRHLTFRAPGTSAYHFHITTWPGYLSITGDMDAFTFSRLPDMLEFHRSPQDQTIDYGYWAQKAVAAGRGGTETFSEDRYRGAVRNIITSHIAGRPFSEARLIVREASTSGLLTDVPSNQNEAAQIASEWWCPVDDTQPFQDIWEYSLTEAAFGFRWACHAIRWGIRRYDLAKAGNTQADHDRRVLAGEV